MVLKCSKDGRTLTFDANDAGSVIAFPGGNSKFTVRYDAGTGKYIALVNNNTDDRYWFQRNVLSILVSDDLKNWKLSGTVLSDPTVGNDYALATMHGFQYVDWVIDGNDILLAVREAMGDSENFHDANHTTFYRIKNYKQYIA